MSSRDDILNAVRTGAPKLERPLPVVPLYDAAPPADLVAAFKTTLARMGGIFLEPNAEAPLEPVLQRLKPGMSVFSSVPEIQGDFIWHEGMAPKDLASVEYGIVRASFAVAETGSVCLTDSDLKIRTSGFLPQHLFVLLDPAQIVINLHHAYQRPEFHSAAYAVLQSGPSATADIEGVLVRGAQGVRSLSVLLLAP